MFGYKTENGIVPAGNNRFAVLSDSCVQMPKQQQQQQKVTDVKEIKETKKTKKTK